MLFVSTVIPALRITILFINLATASPLSLSSTVNDGNLIQTFNTTSLLIPTCTTTSVLNPTQPRNELVLPILLILQLLIQTK